MAKLEVMCARALQAPMNRLLDGFTRDTGHEVEVNYGTVGGLQARLAKGETADVLVLSAAMIDRMQEAGSLLRDSRADVCRTRVGVAVRDGAPVPDVSTAEAFKAVLLGARSVAFSDAKVGGSAAVHLPKVFAQLGIAGAVNAKAMPQPNGAEVARRVAEGGAEIGMTLIAEIAPIAGARVVGPLPAPHDHEVTYTAAVPASAANRDDALALVRAVTGVTVRDIWRAAGFE